MASAILCISCLEFIHIYHACCRISLCTCQEHKYSKEWYKHGEVVGIKKDKRHAFRFGQHCAKTKEEKLKLGEEVCERLRAGRDITAVEVWVNSQCM